MNELIEAHYRKHRNNLVHRISFRAGGVQEAEDVVQDAYVRAMQYFDSYDVTKEFDLWFSRVLFNALKDHRRSERGYTVVEFDEEHEEGIPCQQYNEEVVKQILQRIEDKAPPAKEILYLHFKYGYRVVDIHALVGGGIWAIHKTVSRFREELKELYL